MLNNRNTCRSVRHASLTRLCRSFFLSILALCCSSVVYVSPAQADNSGMNLIGVNISGGEFNPLYVPGIYNTNYVYPSQSEINYFASKGMTVIRVPFSWERMQPTVNGALDTAELARLDAVVNMCTAKGMSTVLDPHNYGAYRNITVGVPGGHPNTMFADFWKKMAAHYLNNPKVILGLMNEPIGPSMTAATWLASAQAAINAIRQTGSKHLILVPSTYWDHPKDFVQVNAATMINITDPGNNYAYEVHQYLDYDGSGTHTDYLSVTDSVATLSSFTAWCRANHRTAFLGELGVTTAPGALADLSAMMQYMHANKDVWSGFTYWTAGAWYPTNYIFSCNPINGVDTEQMKTLVANLGTPTPTPVSYTHLTLPTNREV